MSTAQGRQKFTAATSLASPTINVRTSSAFHAFCSPTPRRTSSAATFSQRPTFPTATRPAWCSLLRTKKYFRLVFALPARPKPAFAKAYTHSRARVASSNAPILLLVITICSSSHDNTTTVFLSSLTSTTKEAIATFRTQPQEPRLKLPGHPWQPRLYVLGYAYRRRLQDLRAGSRPRASTSLTSRSLPRHMTCTATLPSTPQLPSRTLEPPGTMPTPPTVEASPRPSSSFPHSHAATNPQAAVASHRFHHFPLNKEALSFRQRNI